MLENSFMEEDAERTGIGASRSTVHRWYLCRMTTVYKHEHTSMQRSVKKSSDIKTYMQVDVQNTDVEYLPIKKGQDFSRAYLEILRKVQQQIFHRRVWTSNFATTRLPGYSIIAKRKRKIRILIFIGSKLGAAC